MARLKTERVRVCELLLSPFLRNQEGKSFVRIGGEMTSGSGDLRGAGAMDQGDDQITQGGHNLGGVTGAQAGTVFAKTNIAHIVRTVFNTSMPAVQVEQAPRTSLGGG